MEDIAIKAAYIFIEKAKELAANNNLNEALHYFNEALKQDPRNHKAYTLLAEIYMNLEDYQKAEEHAQKALMYKSNSVQAWLILANVLDEQGEYAKALKQLEYAVKYADESADVYYLMGYIYAEIEDFSKSVEYMKKALSVDPNHEDALRDLEDIKQLI